MSVRLATAQRLGGETETYPTPSWCVDRLLDEVDLPRSGHWLEPAVGDGAIVNAVRKRPEYAEVKWYTNDVRPSCGDVCSDFLTWSPSILSPYEVSITNPPFSLAREFLEVSRKISRITVMLLRINWLGSAERAEMFRAGGMPEQILVLPNRPAFVNGKTDSCEYAWWIWTRRRVDEARVRVLAVTPRGERK